MLTRRSRRQRKADLRRTVVESYTRELKEKSAGELLANTPSYPGYHAAPQFDVRRSGIELAVLAFRPHDRPGEVWFAVQAVSQGRFYRVFVDGFKVVDSGEASDLTDEDWGYLNL